MASWGGVGRYTVGLLGGLAEIEDCAGLELTALRLPRDAHLFPPETTCRVRWLDCEHEPWSLRGLREAERALSSHADVFHTPHVAVLPPGFAGAKVATLHDIIPLQCPSTMRSWGKRLTFRCLVQHVVGSSDWIIVGSQQVVRDCAAQGILLRHVSAIHHGVETRLHRVSPQQQRSACASLGLPTGSILWLGALRKHKNLEALISAYLLLPEALRLKHHLCLCGDDRTPYARELVAATARLVGHETIRFTGFVADELLPALYSSAAVFVMPSLSEGFGLPALEAAACGTLVLASERVPAIEYLGRHALYFDPRNEVQIAELLQAALAGGLSTRVGLFHRRADAAQAVRSFTWRAAAFKTADVYARARSRRVSRLTASLRERSDKNRDIPVPAIRAIRLDDQPALTEFFRLVNEDCEGAKWFHPHPFTPEAAAAICRKATQGRDAYAVAEVDGRNIVGYGMLRGFDEGYETPSFGVYVLPHYRHRGIGRLILYWAIGEAIRAGAHRIMIKVYTENTRARTLYEAEGTSFSGAMTADGKQLIGYLSVGHDPTGAKAHR